jgi:hypothetical protein
MTLAEFYATHRSPQAIIIPRRAIRLGTARRMAGVTPGDPKPSVSSAKPPAGGGVDKKH